GACDNHDDCAGTEVCVYWQQSCAPTCTPGSTDCGPSLYCDACATSSCPACNDCLAACVLPPPPPE
ncbi:MAG: hypothetical protein IT373_29870, partial [Polyangiaceae bacterium]|nr:hypothetical protein [Polyangiaceae bacterium]